MRRFLAFTLLGFACLLWLSNYVYPARTFNGTTDIVTIPGITGSLNINGPMAISALVYITSHTGQFRGVVTKEDFGANKIQYALIVNNFNEVLAEIGDGGAGKAAQRYQFLTVPTNRWVQIGLDVDSGKNVRPVMDGIPDTFSATGGFFPGSNGTNVLIGAYYNNAPTIGLPFPGTVAEVGIWNAHLANNEWLALGTLDAASKLKSCTPPNRVHPTALVGYWPLNGYASPEVDLSGQVHLGTLTGTTVANHSPCSKPGGATGPTH